MRTLFYDQRKRAFFLYLVGSLFVLLLSFIPVRLAIANFALDLVRDRQAEKL